MDEKLRKLSKDELLKLSNEKSRQITRNSILGALVLLAAEKPFEKITVTEIVDRAGVSRTAFYRNFKSKTDVVKELDNLIVKLVDEFFDDKADEDKSRASLFDLFTFLTENKKYCDVLLNSKLISYEILCGKTYVDKKINTYGAYDYYDVVAVEIALKKVIIEWCKNGMAEPPEKMADYCVSFARKILINRP